MSYSPDGKALVFSAVRDGQNDIYLLRAGSRKVEQLTDDLFDDVQPVFLPGGQGLVFSSNRYLDSAGRARPATFQNVVNNYDLFQYHLDGRALPVETLVSTISNETRPRAISDDEILYLGEESGVRALYRYSLKTKQRSLVTNWLPNMQDFDYNASHRGPGVCGARAGARHPVRVPRLSAARRAAADQNRPPANAGRPLGCRREAGPKPATAAIARRCGSAAPADHQPAAAPRRAARKADEHGEYQRLPI